LTRPLLSRVRTLHVVELDRTLVAALASLRDEKNSGALIVHHANALDFDFTALQDGARRVRVVGNLPYNISTPLLFHLLAQRDAIDDLVVMVQKEVARRIVAAPGGKDYGRLTVMLAAWLDAELCFDVGPGAFKPPPRVWSTVLHLRTRASPRFSIADEQRFADLVRIAFSMRRKTLGRGLASLLTRTQIESIGIDPGVRAETLPASEFAKLAQLLETR